MTAPGAVGVAGLARRLLSLVYETLLVAALALVGVLPLAILIDSLDPAVKRLLYQAYLVLLAGAYFVWQWTRGGQTLAMKTWRLKLVTGDGAPLSFRHSLRRFLYALAGLALCGGGFAWALLDRDRQFLHDRLAGTKIVTFSPATRSFRPQC